MLKKFMAGKIFQRLKDFKEALGMLIFFGAFIAGPLNPDLVTVVRTEDLVIALPSGPHSAGTKENSNFHGGYTLLTIELVNRSTELIQGVELTVDGVMEVAGSAATSTSKHLSRDLADMGRIEKRASGTYFFPALSRIPPRQAIKIQVAGRFAEQFTQRVRVVSSAKTARTVESIPVYGLAGFLYENAGVIGAVLVAILVALGLRRMSAVDRQT